MEKQDKAGITVMRNGPYKVDASIPLNQAIIACDADGNGESWQAGKVYPSAGKDYLLCRCGRSARKPYCDGKHTQAGFRAEEHPPQKSYVERAVLLKGAGIDLLDDASLCVQARFCDKGSTIWRILDKTDRQEIRDEVIREACHCPAGRLTAVDKSGQPVEPELPREISLVEDPANAWKGPLWIKGGITIANEGGGRHETRNRVTLCRCGESGNMPYCDASHYDCPHMQGLDS